jgi:TatA/E family protein of Tat protein translocase
VFNIGPAELMVIFVLALLVFGPKKLPEVSRQIGRGIREFRKASDQFQGEIQGALSLDDDEDETTEDETTEEVPNVPASEPSADTQPISSNGRSADSAKAVPEATDGVGAGDDGKADDPGASERTD